MDRYNRRAENRAMREEFARRRARGVAIRHAARLRNLANSRTVSPELRRLRERAKQHS